MKNGWMIASFVSIALINSPAAAKKQPELTPMELQALQSREYQTTKDQVFSSVMSVFQDLGYQISAADMGSGFITAGSANKNKTGFWEAMGGMSSSGSTRATAFVETMPSGYTRARLNFLNTKNISSAYGRSSANDKPVLEPKTYQIAFERIEQALFERGALTKTATQVQPTVVVSVLSAPSAAQSTARLQDAPPQAQSIPVAPQPQKVSGQQSRSKTDICARQPFSPSC